MALNWNGSGKTLQGVSEFNYAGRYSMAPDGRDISLVWYDPQGQIHDLGRFFSTKKAEEKADSHHLGVIKARHKKLLG